MRRFILFIAVFAGLITVASLAQAQDGSLADRLSRLERDVNFLQRQVYRGISQSDAGDVQGAAPTVSASAEARLGQMSEELRALRGQIEQAQFQARQNAEELRKLSADVEYRFQAIEQRQAQMMTPLPVPPAMPAAHSQGFSPDGDGLQPVNDEAAAPNQTTKRSPTGKDFPDANAHYNHAFKLLNDKNYTAAAASFDAFVKKYPTDPLTSNAYYWLGESYYVRSDFTRASEGFRKGFETNPEGEKAADNLLKLALSLAQVKRVPEACIVLKQVESKYAQSNTRTATRAGEQRTKLQCK